MSAYIEGVDSHLCLGHVYVIFYKTGFVDVESRHKRDDGKYVVKSVALGVILFLFTEFVSSSLATDRHSSAHLYS